MRRIDAFCTTGTSPGTRPVRGLTCAGHGPPVLVLGGISARADLSGWPGVIGHGALSPDRATLVGAEVDGPTPAADADRIVDRLAAARLGPVDVVGASYGGQVALALAERHPERVRRLVVVAAAHRPHAAAVARRHVQQRILAAVPGPDGVALARALALTTYRSDAALDARFDAAGVRDWLDHHGRTFADRFTAARYAALSAAVDAGCVAPARVLAPTTVVGFDTDTLVPPWLLAELAAGLPVLERFVVLPSRYGHDGFLKETAAVCAVLTDALATAREVAA